MLSNPQPQNKSFADAVAVLLNFPFIAFGFMSIQLLFQTSNHFYLNAIRNPEGDFTLICVSHLKMSN